MLPSYARLRRSRDFQAVYRARKSWATPCLSLHVRRDQRGSGAETARAAPVRIGFVISKKVAKRAHVRNLLKRRMREISRRQLLPQMRAGRDADLLFVARGPVLALDFVGLSREMAGLMRQAGLLAEPPTPSLTED